MSVVQDYDIYIPNEIFNDLKSNSDLKPVHIPFTYCYYYLLNYLYQFCKYIDKDGKRVTQDRIKEMLGYNASNKQLNYIMKKDGVLDNLGKKERDGILDRFGYTFTTSEYPIRWGIEDGRIFFLTNKDLENSDFLASDRNFKIKKPMKAFYREPSDEKEQYLSGTFYEKMNTHKIPFAYFLEFMANKALGVTAFYIYAYLIFRTRQHKGKYQASFVQLEREIGLSDSTIKRYIKNLEDHTFIEVDHKPFNKNLKEEEREANIYQIT